MAINSNCGCMGTLGCIAGPLYHCPPPPANPDYYLNFPYYNGPCPPCEGDNCRHHHCCHCCRHEGHSCPSIRGLAAMFTSGAPVNLPAGEAVPLSPCMINPDCFGCENGFIRIAKPGLYLAVWTANIPSYQNFSARLCLHLNGSPLGASGRQICCQADNTSCCACTQVLLQTPPGGLLCLSADSDICLDTGCNMDNVFALSLVKLQ